MERTKTNSMKKIKFIALGLIGMCMFNHGQAQYQVHISQYNMQRAFVNPAAISEAESMNASLFHKSQWVGFDGAPSFQGLNFNMPLNNDKNAIGVTFMHDKIGVTRNMNLSGTYAYRIQTGGGGHLAFALSADLVFLQSNLAEVETTEQNDQVFMANTPTYILPNFKYGMYYFKKKFFAGFAIPNLLHNRVVADKTVNTPTTFDGNAMHFIIHTGTSINFSKTVDLLPSLLVKSVSGAPMQIDLNMEARINEKLGAGLSYRTGKILSVLFNMEITKEMRAGYAYNYNFSELSTATSSSHELMIKYTFPEKKEQPSLEIESETEE
jgi:type IX secretion system PorP/SprF family membrane protein